MLLFECKCASPFGVCVCLALWNWVDYGRMSSWFRSTQLSTLYNVFCLNCHHFFLLLINMVPLNNDIELRLTWIAYTLPAIVHIKIALRIDSVQLMFMYYGFPTKSFIVLIWLCDMRSHSIVHSISIKVLLYFMWTKQ